MKDLLAPHPLEIIFQELANIEFALQEGPLTQEEKAELHRRRTALQANCELN